ncbi:MAG: ABC transporter ATP-binding protein [Lactobacillus sp.]|uniref:ATP-binding cassette domain-containing protein n=1 Tax=Bombilactobacillus bombi TaxID=1303590 RepID=UPI0035E7FE4F|nr:ABC transporter ATP-binding protein [Lactobacillus sp.]
MVLQIKNLSKQYKQRVFTDLNFKLQEQTIYGLLGRNGVGKSTLLNIISNRIFATTGEVLLDGQLVTNNDTALNHIFLMSENNLYPQNFKVQQLWKMSAAFYRQFDWDLATDFAQQFNLDPSKKLRNLSTGYRTIAKMLTALCVPCDYIFLDEPILGLDAANRETFYQALLQAYDHQPRTFVIATHIIGEIEQILEKAIILKQGKIIAQGDIDEITQSVKLVQGPKDLVQSLLVDQKVLESQDFANTTSVYVQNLQLSTFPEEIEVNNVDLQTCFIRLTKERHNYES